MEKVTSDDVKRWLDLVILGGEFLVRLTPNSKDDEILTWLKAHKDDQWILDIVAAILNLLARRNVEELVQKIHAEVVTA